MRKHPTFGAAAGSLTLALGALLVAPGAAGAAPVHNRGLTIGTSANPITAGAGVLIYGQLRGRDHAHRRIVLYHRIDPAPRFTPIGVARTDAAGFYEFVRADGVVDSNRNWFVVGPGYRHSRTVHERVAAVLSLTGSTTSATTVEPVTFTGTVTPHHPNERVLLQEQDSGYGNGWRTVASTRTDGGSSFTLVHRFRMAGSYALRAYLHRDARNLAGESSTVNLTIQQQQDPSFTISGSAPIVTDGQPVTVSGTLYEPGSTTVPQPNVSVTLYGATPHGAPRALASTITSASGGYTFTQVPTNNISYRVRADGHPMRESAPLYVGVADVVSIGASAPAVPLGGLVTISGTVTPQHAGHVIRLQQQGPGGHWFDVVSGRVGARSTYSFAYRPGQTGMLALRVQIPGGPANVGSDSPPLSLNVSGFAPLSALPSAS